jgi:uncharacterized CHY-type Zn-finger protein
MPNCFFCGDDVEEHYFTNSDTDKTICMSCVLQLHDIILDAAGSVNECDYCNDKNYADREVTKYDA